MSIAGKKNLDQGWGATLLLWATDDFLILLLFPGYLMPINDQYQGWPVNTATGSNVSIRKDTRQRFGLGHENLASY
jgi:hypothetical protein